MELQIHSHEQYGVHVCTLRYSTSAPVHCASRMDTEHHPSQMRASNTIRISTSWDNEYTLANEPAHLSSINAPATSKTGGVVGLQRHVQNRVHHHKNVSFSYPAVSFRGRLRRIATWRDPFHFVQSGSKHLGLDAEGPRFAKEGFWYIKRIMGAGLQVQQT